MTGVRLSLQPVEQVRVVHLERRAPGLQRLDRATATRRLMGMLARKGYNGGLAAAVVREVLDGSSASDDGAFDDLDVDPLLP